MNLRYEQLKCRALKFEPKCNVCRSRNTNYTCDIHMMYLRMGNFIRDRDPKSGVYLNWIHAPYRPYLRKTLEVWWPEHLDYFNKLELLG